jgi:hypothetical protein
VDVLERSSHLDVLKWARKNGCEWDELTCQNAAQGGHLDVLKWARKNGCEWNIQLCIDNAHDVVIVDWIRANSNEQGAAES